MWPCGATFPLPSLRANCRARLRTGRTGGLKHLELSDRDRVKCATASGDQTLSRMFMDVLVNAMHAIPTIMCAWGTSSGAGRELVARFARDVVRGA